MEESLEKCVITSPIPAGVMICPHMKDYEKTDLLLCTAGAGRLLRAAGTGTCNDGWLHGKHV